VLVGPRSKLFHFHHPPDDFLFFISVDSRFLEKQRILFYDEGEKYESAIPTLTDHLVINPANGMAYSKSGLANSEIGKGEKCLARKTGAGERRLRQRRAGFSLVIWVT
jgi:hypothetical protein